jgi:SHS family lactate transporter-like MFS transporter
LRVPAPDVARQQRHVVIAAFLGWTLDAFDFFLMVFVLSDIAKTFATDRTTITWAITLTLAARPLGAFLFGRIADHFGRRPTLMIDVLCYSMLGLLTGFASSLTMFFIVRTLFGIAMGGEWGVGSSLAMESIPPHWRGRVSGLLQAGYPTGYLLTAALYWVVYPYVGWRGMFMLGVLPALLVLYIRRHVPESPDWKERAQAPRPSLARVLRGHVGLAVYAVVLMTAFNFFSHGTQDLYPAYMSGQLKFDRPTVSAIAIVYNIGAIIGGLVCGALSQRIGRRWTIGLAALLALPVLPLWAFTADPVWVSLGAFLMQVCVQGAWGVIPAHLNELSPADIRGTFPGFVYQLGNLLAAANATIQSAIGDATGHLNWALAGVAGLVAVVIAVLVAVGPEGRHVHMGRRITEPAA